MALNQTIREIPISKLVVSKFNVRRELGDISELVASIKELGVLEPIIVRPRGDKYEVVVGSRRLAAAKEAGLKTIPAIVKELDDTQALATSLIENIQRGELDIREEGEAYLILKQRLNSIKKIEEVTGISYKRITESLEAYAALKKLEPIGIKVVSRTPARAEERIKGMVLPKYHATELEKVFKTISLPRKEADKKYIELARAIAPYEREEVKKILTYFKKYPEKDVNEIIRNALSKITLETEVPVNIARKVDELAEKKGLGMRVALSRIIERGLEVEYKEIQREEMPAKAPLELPLGPLSEQIHNKFIWNLARINRKEFDFFTIGYSERNMKQFIDILKEAGVKTLIDVRYNPFSQFKPEFNKDALQRVLENNGIEYLHLPQLGVPREIREKVALTGKWEELFKWYDENVLPMLDSVIELKTLKKPFAFMCVEMDPTKCHRHRLALALEKKGLKSYDL